MNRNSLVVMLGLLLAGLAVFVAGIGWGLPSHRIDPYLFGQHPVWSGQEIIAHGGGYPPSDPSHTVNTSAHPMDLTRPTVVDGTDAQRARTVRVYRVQSYNPDEQMTLASLARMKPAQHDFDPRFYDYGGLWVYPVGAMLKLASAAGFVHLTPDLAWYLDRPEAFGRFYVIARLYSVLWGLVGIVAVYLVVRRIGGSVTAAAVGGLCFLLMPIVVNATHEAKPHLAGSVLMLLTVLAAGRYCESGLRRDWLAAVVLGGLSLGMVVTSLPVLLVLPAMVYLREWPRSRADVFNSMLRAVGGPLIAVCVYFITNPYVGINLIRNRELLQSDFGHASGFYHLGLKGIPNALLIIGLGTSFALAAAGLAGIVVLVVQVIKGMRRHGFDAIRTSPTHILFVLLATTVAAQFAVLAENYNPDHARYALAFEICLAVEAVRLVENSLRFRASRNIAFAVLVLTTGWMGAFYVRGYLRESSDSSTRMVAARQIQDLVNRGKTVVAVTGDPGPFNTPPLDLWRTTIIAYPDLQLGAIPDRVDISIRFSDLISKDRFRICELLCSTPISLGSKNFDIQTFTNASRNFERSTKPSLLCRVTQGIW